MFLGRSEEWGDKTDDRSECQEPNRFEEVKLLQDGVFEQDTKKQTGGSRDGKKGASGKAFSVTEEQVAQLAEIDLGLESAQPADCGQAGDNGYVQGQVKRSERQIKTDGKERRENPYDREPGQGA